MSTVSEYIESEITRAQWHEIVSLIYSTWPKPNKSVDQLVEETIDLEKNNPEQFTRRFVIWEYGKAVAHSKIFPRTIFTGLSKIKVAALTAVCVSKNHRGSGLGREIIEHVFQYLSDSFSGVTLFQTNVPEFYKQFGAIRVNNRFVNRSDIQNPDSNPWWEDNIMIYPGSYEFPTTLINLNGPAY